MAADARRRVAMLQKVADKLVPTLEALHEAEQALASTIWRTCSHNRRVGNQLMPTKAPDLLPLHWPATIDHERCLSAVATALHQVGRGDRKPQRECAARTRPCAPPRLQVNQTQADCPFSVPVRTRNLVDLRGLAGSRATRPTRDECQPVTTDDGRRCLRSRGRGNRIDGQRCGQGG